MDAHKESEGCSRLVARVSDAYSFAAINKHLTDKHLEIVAPGGAQPWILATINKIREQKKLSQQVLVVVSTGREAEDLADFLKLVEPEAEVLEFVSWETLPHERLSPSAETVGKRLKVLHRLNQLQ
ncbi:MAG: hypothetical protein EBQ79_01485, partial [Actinobacteria bacterium]|nr:hypothetical protein [Actinomycetota bacterium]